MMSRLPPNNPSAEIGLLGCFMLKPDTLVEIVAEYPAMEEFFFDQRHSAIYRAMREDLITDPLSVWQRLRDGGFSIGIDYVSAMMNQCATGLPEEAHSFARMLRSDYARRRMLEASFRISELAFNEKSAGEALTQSEQLIAGIGESVIAEREDDIKSLMRKVLDEMDEAFQNKGSVRGLRVGFRDFDWMTLGLRGGQMIVIAARPAVGKTSWSMNMADFVAAENRKPVGIFSLEMSGEELAFRMACSRAEVDSRDAKAGKLLPAEVERLTDACNKIANSPIHICDKSGLTVSQLSSRARRMALRYKIKILIVDYIQLMGTKLKGTRNDQITEISNGLKGLARDLNIPVIVLSQLNRAIEKEDREPRMSDLRDSGSIEQDADIIVFLSPKEAIDSQSKYVDALVAKHRGGPVGKITLKFNAPLTRFYSVSKTGDVQI